MNDENAPDPGQGYPDPNEPDQNDPNYVDTDLDDVVVFTPHNGRIAFTRCSEVKVADGCLLILHEGGSKRTVFTLHGILGMEITRSSGTGSN